MGSVRQFQNLLHPHKGFVMVQWLRVACVLSLLLLGVVSEGSITQKGLLLIPGLGRSDRLLTVVHNLRILRTQYAKSYNTQWDCIAYIYAPREVASFWSMTSDLAYLHSECKVIEMPNKRVTENLHMVQPALIDQHYQKVLIFLDDCKIQSAQTFNLTRLLQIMDKQKLTVASPMIVGANKGGGQKFRNIMQTPPLAGSDGYVSNFVEIFVWVMTMPAYTALWELLHPAVNPYAWGYDFWYDGYAADRVPGHKMGIIASMQVKHEQNLDNPALGRTDNTAVNVKWNAVLAQERHYKKYLNVDLGKYRAHMRIANTSWNGAVQSIIPRVVV